MLRALYPGRLNDICELSAAAKAQSNATYESTTTGIESTTKAGVLAGLVSTPDTGVDNTVEVHVSGNTVPLGVFAYDYDKSDLLPSPGESAIGKVPFYEFASGGVYETDIYEDQTYSAGEKLYVMEGSGALSNQEPGTKWVVGVVIAEPSTTGYLRFQALSPFIEA